MSAAGGIPRLKALDGWRGVCAVLVAVMHLEASGYLSGSHLVRNADFLVDFFFVLSGFIIAHAYGQKLAAPGDVARMLWRRFARLWPLHAALLALLVGLELAAHAISGLTGIARRAAAFDPAMGQSLAAIPTHLVMLHSFGLHDKGTWNVPSWSISAEFWSSVVLAAIALFCGRWQRLAAAAIALLAATAVAVFASDFMRTHYDYGFQRCLFGFLVGRLLYDVRGRWQYPDARATVVEVATIALVGLFVVNARGTEAALAAPIVFAVAVWVFASGRGRISRLLEAPPLQWLGTRSYSIYLVHGVVLIAVSRAGTVASAIAGRLPGIAGPPEPGLASALLSHPILADLLTMAYLAAVLLASAATWRWIEMPAQKALNARFERSQLVRRRGNMRQEPAPVPALP